MQVLVDYDNIPQLIRRNGPRYVADRLCSALWQRAKSAVLQDRRIELRLYGGWYAGNSLSSAGQRLSADIQSDFPLVLKPDPTDPTVSMTVAAFLAHSLVSLPRHTLFSTFRTRPGLEKVICTHPSKFGCREPLCPLIAVFDYFDTDSCSHPGCQVKAGLLVNRRGEQKLVDTMLVADLIYLSHNREPYVVVVTSDDDVWPGIIVGMQLGTHVIHVRTKYDGRPSSYLAGVPGKYSGVTL
jgi:hypothetical protein